MKKIIPSILVITALFFALTPNNVFADGGQNSADIDITIKQSLTMTLSSEALTLSSDSGLNTDYMTVTGSTNSSAGFTISFNVNNPYNDLKHENATIRESIPSLTEDKTAAEFPETAWGYTLETENQTFKKIPLTSENIFSTEENGQGTYNFGLGAKVAADQAAGRYENELIFTIVANPIPPKTISRIATMQQMTPEICATSAEHETAQLKDTRDNKTYWVTKLKDGNCWMTQNLDYDLSVTENQTLTPATSNVTANRTVVPANTDLATFSTDNNAIYYLDGGDNYFTNGTTQTAGLSTLPEDDVNRHYAQGDYYSWKAATAGQGTTGITNVDVNESICPAGWRLPTSNSADANYSFGNLVKQYGYTGTNGSASDATLLASPLFFARGGLVNSGSLSGQGSSGHYWSSRASLFSVNAYVLVFSNSDVSPSFGDGRNLGLSVRCVAKGTPQTLTLKDNITEETIFTNNFEVSFKLPEAPAKENYNFLGYDENKTATTPTYHPGDLIGQSKTLYAIYKRPLFNMQDVATWKNYLNLEEQVQVKDTRDGKIYWVSKLKDGNIWMTQNLDYDLSVAANRTLTPATSNVTANRTVTPVTWGTDDNSVYYMDGGDNYFANGTTQTAGLASLPEDSIDRHYAQGDYYSWKAATAGQGTTDIIDADVNESICPSGWRLPTSNSDSANYSFGNLVKQYGYTGANQSASDATLLASPLFFARGGRVDSGSLDNQGSGGYYWSSRAYSDSNFAYYLYFSSSSVGPSYHLYRDFGHSVRCVVL